MTGILTQIGKNASGSYSSSELFTRNNVAWREGPLQPEDVILDGVS